MHGSAGNGAAAAIRGGTVVIHGDAAARLGVSMKGGTVLVGGQLRLHGRLHGAEGHADRLRRRRRRIRRLDVRNRLLRRWPHRRTRDRRRGRGAVARGRRVAGCHAGAASCPKRRQAAARISRKSWPAASSGTSISANGKSGRRPSESGDGDHRCRRQRGIVLSRRSSKTFRPRPSRDSTVSAASARCASGAGRPSTTSRSCRAR